MANIGLRHVLGWGTAVSLLLPSMGQAEELNLHNWRGRVVVVCFLSTSAEAQNAAGPGGRAQVVALQSLQRQFPSDIQVVLVDVAVHRTVAEQYNTRYDWNIQDMPMFVDKGFVFTRRYNVTKLPTTIWFRPDGSLNKLVPGYASPARLAQELNSIIKKF